jgi:GPH family glycoside/pentoside/hexuronide:cation symporter
MDNAMAGQAPQAKLPFVTKVLYGVGTVAFGVKDQGFSALLMLFYNQVIGLPAAWVGAAIMVAMVADALFDPILGQVSDDFRSRWGRRHPFMYAAALPIALSYFFLWTPPEMSHPAQFAYLVVMAIIVRFCISLYEIPSTALLAEFTNDYDERTTLVAHRYFFGVVGGIVMNVVAFKYLLRPSAEHPVGHLNPAGYLQYAWIAALIMLVSVLLSTVGTHRRIAALPQQPPAPRLGLAETLRGMKQILFHRAYASVLLATLFFAMSAGLNAALTIYFTTYFWELSASQIATVSLAAFGGILLAFLVALPLSARFGKKQTALVMFGLSMVCGATPLALRLLDVMPANGAPALIPILMVSLALVTTCTISASILAVSMVADVTEQVQLATGRRAEGLLFSAVTMVNKAISGMGVFISGLLLTLVAFPSNALPGKVAESVLDRLALIHISATATMSVLAIACLAFYPITRTHHAETVRRLGTES